MSLPVPSHSIQNTALAPKAMAGKPVPAQKDKSAFSFRDLIDIVNPLQHIPIIGTIYREITGDEIKNTSRIAGGALFGGIAGAALGAVNALFVEKTGEDVGQMAMHGAGIGPQTAEAVENVPVIEVRPAPRQAKAAGEIIWDAPVKIAGKPIEKIPSEPVKTAAEPVAKPVAETLEIAAAMPAPKQLADLKTPEAAPQFNQPEKAAIPQNMMQALAKYESMQRLADGTGAIGQPPQKTRLAFNKPASGSAGIRAYN